jgi:general secretion pathway protein B
MSFILDALKKSENDRQRRSGPALFEVKVAAPRTRLPPWAIAIAALLVVNLGIVMWMLLRHPERAGTAAGAAPAAAAPAAAAPAVTASNPGPAAPAPAAPAPAAAVAATPAAVPAAAPASAPAADQANPEDYAPAEEPPAQPFGGHVQRGTAAGVPLYQDAAATPGTQIPQLRLDLHVYAVRAQDRFVMINMRKLREGESLPEGVRVESITPDGAVLSYNGSRFLLPRE